MISQIMEERVYAVAILVLILAVSAWFLLLRPATEHEDMSKGLIIEESITVDSKANDDKVLNPVQFKKFKLVKSTQASHNTKLLMFAIPGDKPVGLPIGRHISVMAHINGEKVMRPYTPVSRPDQKGYFELLIKSYSLGKMSSYLFDLEEGSELEVRGPVGRFKYTPNQYKHMAFVCGGSGLTPCLQVIRCILEGSVSNEDSTCMTLFYQNRTPDDILLKKDIFHLQQTHPNRLTVVFALSNPSPGWGKGTAPYKRYYEHSGYINPELIKGHINARDYPFVGLCGPSGFNEQMIEHLTSCGYDKGEHIHVW
jgi:cytochrome-b5 reductase